jgi:hypothetical protein
MGARPYVPSEAAPEYAGAAAGVSGRISVEGSGITSLPVREDRAGSHTPAGEP